MTASAQDPFIGRRLGNYRLEKLLGQGGMARAYFGWDDLLERPVAVKVLKKAGARPGYAEAFVQEAKAIARLRHENIIQIYHAGQEPDLSYFVMEYVDGLTLAQKLAQVESAGRRHLSYEEILYIGRKIAGALDYAHSQEIIHRDVKPSNILLANDGRVFLADFGLSQSPENDAARELYGSPHYAAPEQAHNRAAAVPQSDLYSLAVILFEALTGRVPFDDPADTALALQHLTLPPPSPREINPGLNSMVEEVLLKALSKQPTDRYETGQQLIESLAKALLPGNNTPPAETLAGRQLDEYRLDALLGQGGMAQIFRGYDIRLKRPAAIKVIDASHQADADYQSRFEQEAQAIAQLSHPHIVNIYRYGEVGGLLYLAMQYIEGQDLRQYLAGYRAKDSLIPAEEAARIIRHICRALDYAHSKGIVHRDIKPSNIMLDNSGQAILTDFGLALLADRSTRGKVFGSPAYIAPEQVISSANAGPLSDFYSIGVILYEMFTGRLPFSAENPLDLALLHMSEPPLLPREIRPELSPTLETVLLRTLAKEPEHRYADGAALVMDLERALKINEPAVSSTPEVGRPTHPESAAPLPPIPTAVRSLPPVPAAVLLAEPAAKSPPVPPILQQPALRRFRPFLVLFSTLILITAIVLAWYTLPVRGRGENGNPATSTATAVPALADSIVNDNALETTAPTLPATTPTPSPSSTPAATQTATATEITTVTTAESSAVITANTPTRTPSPTPTVTPTPTATPLIIVTRETDGMVMILIPPTTFIMGAGEEDSEAEEDERPAHEISLDGYYIDQYEVSVSQYALFLNNNGGYVNACSGFTCLSTQFETAVSYLVEQPDGFQAQAGFATHPINNVSWFGAQAYCQWAGGRLPTEAEWELAARGTDGRLFPWGSQPPDELRAVFGSTLFTALQPVTALAGGQSAYTLFGMAGSLWEWASDGYDPQYYSISPAQNPTGPQLSMLAPRVLRGGGYTSPAADLRASNRDSQFPNEFRQIPDIGFRCARSIIESQ